MLKKLPPSFPFSPAPLGSVSPRGWFLRELIVQKNGLTGHIDEIAYGPRGVPLRMEEIAKIDPQWLYVIDRNAGTGTAVTKEGKPVTPSKTLFDNDLIRGTTAARKGQVVFLDPQIWYLLGSAGPLAMRANVAQLRAALASAR